MLNRTDWRALQWTGSDASEPIQLEFRFQSLTLVRFTLQLVPDFGGRQPVASAPDSAGADLLVGSPQGQQKNA